MAVRITFCILSSEDIQQLVSRPRIFSYYLTSEFGVGSRLLDKDVHHFLHQELALRSKDGFNLELPNEFREQEIPHGLRRASDKAASGSTVSTDDNDSGADSVDVLKPEKKPVRAPAPVVSEDDRHETKYERQMRQMANQLLQEAEWPKHDVQHLCCDINVRIKNCHYVLNDTNKNVDHGGCLFQTRVSQNKGPALQIDKLSYAFLPNLVKDLCSRVESLTPDKIESRLNRAFRDDAERRRGPVGLASQRSVETMEDLFCQLHTVCQAALPSGKGLLWHFSITAD